MKAYYHLLISQRVRSGFTLIELMMASMLTLVVVGVAGYGTVVMLRENTASSIASDTQYNLNRAADFITEEIKMANSVLTSFTGTGIV
jgi:prepilin-type N-terminal cleavage/methylation domain-containing protein